MELSVEEVEEIVAFVKMHERDEIPDAMWELCLRMQDVIEESLDDYVIGL